MNTTPSTDSTGLGPVILRVQITPEVAARTGADRVGLANVEIRPSALSAAARALLARLVTGGPNPAQAPGRRNIPLPPTTDGLHAWLEGVAEDEAAASAAEEAEDERLILSALGAADEAWISRGGPLGYWMTPDGEPSATFAMDNRRGPIVLEWPRGCKLLHHYERRHDPRLAERRAAVEHSPAMLAERAGWEAWLSRRADIIAAHEAAEAARAAEEAAAVERRAQQLRDWLQHHGTDAMRRRAARGLLPESELIDALRAHAFGALASLPRFERLTAAEVRDALGLADDTEVDYEALDVESCTDAQLELMESIEGSLPGAQCDLRRHVGYERGARSDDPEISRPSVRVTLRVGELTLSREYAAGDDTVTAT